MVKSLSKHSKFLDEMQLFKQQVKQLEDVKKKQAVTEKINKLKKLVEDIDSGHKTLYGFQIKPSLLSNTREEIVNLRLEIRKMLKIS